MTDAPRAEPVAWQYRVSRDGFTHRWNAWDQDERPPTIGRWTVEYRPLYASPPTDDQLRALVDKAWDAAEVFHRYAASHRAKGTPEGSLKAEMNQDLSDGLLAVLAPFAEGR